jgi:hypothetical protein
VVRRAEFVLAAVVSGSGRKLDAPSSDRLILGWLGEGSFLIQELPDPDYARRMQISGRRMKAMLQNDSSDQSSTSRGNRRKTSRWCLLILGAVVAVTASIVCLSLYTQTIYALVLTDIEIEFRITDAEVGAPVPNATIDLTIETDDGACPEIMVQLVTDKDGTARYFRAKTMHEEVIRPLRKPIFLINLTWASASVSANGFRPVKGLWLHDAKPEDVGFVREGMFHRIGIAVPLQPEHDK